MDELLKYQKVDITKDKPNISDIVVGIGWTIDRDFPKDMVVDMALILADEDSVFYDSDDFIYYNNKFMMGRREEIVKHMNIEELYEDTGFDDKEQIKISLFDIPGDVRKMVICAAVYKPKETGHKLSDLKDLQMHIFNEQTMETLFFSKLDKYFINETCLIFGEFYRFEEEWKYEVINEGYIGDLGTLFGVHYRGEKIETIGISEPEEEEPEPIEEMDEEAELERILELETSREERYNKEMENMLKKL